VGTSALGAFGAVSVTAGFASRVFNFLVDGVSAKTGKSVGLRAWNELGDRVKMSLGFALAAGIVASCMLAMLIHPVSVDILKLSEEVQKEAELYWWLRVGLVPILLLNMSLSGILQGFRHVKMSAAINTGQAILEMSGSALVLMCGIRLGGHDGLLAMGIVTLITQVIALAAGFLCILMLPPPEAAGKFSLWEHWFGSNHVGAGSSFLHDPLLQILPRRLGATFSSQSAAKDIEKARPTYAAGSPGSMASTVFGNSDEGSPDSYLIMTREEETRAIATATHSMNMNSITNCQPSPHEVVIVEDDSPAACTRSPHHEPLMDEEEPESLLDFVKDGLNMFIRSMILQLTFFGTLVAASRLGTPSLAAHSIVSQLWALISYAVDGFAAAGIVLGSRLAAQAHDPLRARDAKKHLETLIARVLMAGFLAGVGAATVFAVGRTSIIASFTDDMVTAGVLNHGTWTVLVLSQPINGLIFVYDGLMMASQSFRFIRNYILVGFLVVFCPMIAAEVTVWNALWAVWLTNAAVNVWRLAGAAYLIHVIFMKEFDLQLGSRRSLVVDDS